MEASSLEKAKAEHHQEYTQIPSRERAVQAGHSTYGQVRLSAAIAFIVRGWVSSSFGSGSVQIMISIVMVPREL